jgi:hypothetical protein
MLRRRGNHHGRVFRALALVDRRGMAPRLIWCALVMIRLLAAWPKTSANRTTGTTPEAMTSDRT